MKRRNQERRAQKRNLMLRTGAAVLCSFVVTAGPVFAETGKLAEKDGISVYQFSEDFDSDAVDEIYLLLLTDSEDDGSVLLSLCPESYMDENGDLILNSEFKGAMMNDLIAPYWEYTEEEIGDQSIMLPDYLKSSYPDFDRYGFIFIERNGEGAVSLMLVGWTGDHEKGNILGWQEMDSEDQTIHAFEETDSLRFLTAGFDEETYTSAGGSYWGDKFDYTDTIVWDELPVENAKVGYLIYSDSGVHKTGFASCSFEDRITGEKADTLVGTVTGNVNLRSGAGTENSVLLVIPAGSVVCIEGEDTDGWVPVSYQGTSGYMSADYLTDRRVLTEEEQRESETTAAGSSSEGVSAQFRATMDSYEAFFDSYIAFMQNYQNAEGMDALLMMTDMLNYLDQYTTILEQLDAIDTDSLSAADYLYFVEVYARIMSKLASAL